MQKITIIGRLGRDPRQSEGQGGRAFQSFTVAVNGKYRGTDRTYWYDVMAFDPERFGLLKYMKKGSCVVVTGTLHTEAEKGNDGAYRCVRSITADSIDFTPSTQSGSTETTETRQAESAPAPKASARAPKVEEEPADEPVEIPVKPKASAKKAQPKAVEPEPEPESPDDGEEMPF